MIILIIKNEDRSNKYNPTHKKMHELWRSMMGRCYQPLNGSYHNYGARGVTVCNKWHTYDGFLDDVDKIEGFNLELIISGKLQLDKDIKGRGDIYSLDDCMFVSPQQNYANRRNNREFVAINYNTGDVVITNNREEFCRNNNLDTSTCWRVLQFYESGRLCSGRKHLQHKGWVLQYTDNFSYEKFIDTLKIKKAYDKDSTTIESKLSKLGLI